MKFGLITRHFFEKKIFEMPFLSIIKSYILGYIKDKNGTKGCING